MIPTSQIEQWLREDIGHHDVTNDVPGETSGRLIAKEPGIVAGVDVAGAIFEYLDGRVTNRAETGDRIDEGDVVLEAAGPTRGLLRAERVAVNIAGHASGIATTTRQAVNRAREADADVRIAGTRKTTPGLRGVEKRAIVAGGGDTHRLDLSHMVLIKDNHVAEMGLEAAIEHFRERTSFTTKIEVEIEDIADASRAAEAGADIVMLDNMSPNETEQAVRSLRETATSVGREVLAEASGGITLETIPDYARTGVDIISMGSLTHSAATLDYSFQTA